jgi:AAA domain (dynein-related subfamily)
MRDNLALLVVSDTELEGLPAQAQTLLIGTDTEVLGYHRVSNGAKGRGQAWQIMSDLPISPITYNPVAVVLSDRDLTMLGMGQITNVGIKALYALESATAPATPIAHDFAVEGLRDRLMSGDNSLSQYVTDKRRSQGLSIKPITPITEGVVTTSATAPVTPTMPNKAMSDALVNAMVTIPDKAFAKAYINRKVVNNLTDFEILDFAMASHKNVLIEGHAGSGKTAMVQAYASARGLRYFNVACHIGLEASHLIGRWIPTPDGHFRWQDGAVTEIVRNGGVLLFNEINFAPERFLTFIFSLLDYRREIQLMENGGEVIKAHPDLLIVADMNPDYRGTRPLNQALADRFPERLVFPYDNAIEQKLLGSKALLDMANQLRTEFDKGTINTPISTRNLVAFADNAKALGMDFATYCYINSFEGDEERSAVRLLLTTHRDNIASDFGLPTLNKATFGNSNIEEAVLNTEVGTMVEGMEVATDTSTPDMNVINALEPMEAENV